MAKQMASGEECVVAATATATGSKDDGYVGGGVGGGEGGGGGLGALEFVAALNGDDAPTALRALRRFARTVRRERRMALIVLPRRLGGGGGDDDDGGLAAGRSDEEEEDDDDAIDDDDIDIGVLLGCESHDDERPSGKKRRRRRRKEEREEAAAWKEDTASYNVPFVGTSSARGPTGTVRPGAWPTGLLEAYLAVSPRAVELLAPPVDAAPSGAAGGGGGGGGGGNALVPPHGAVHRPLLRNGRNVALSAAIHVAYLDALSELATASVPVGALVKDEVWRAPRRRRRRRDDPESTVERALALVRLRRQSGEDDGEGVGTASAASAGRHDGIASSIARNHLPALLKLLNDGTSVGGGGGGGGRQGKKGKAGGAVAAAAARGGRCGPLVPAALRVLANLASTSVGAAREVTHGLDGRVNDGVLMTILSPSASVASTKAKAKARTVGQSPFGGAVDVGKKRKSRDGNDEDEEEGDMGGKGDNKGGKGDKARRAAAARSDARSACLRLAASLLESSDATAAAYACTPGSRERKTNAGVAYLALRVGLAGEALDPRGGRKAAATAMATGAVASEEHGEEDYLRSVTRLFAAVRDEVLPSPGLQEEDGRGGAGTKQYGAGRSKSRGGYSHGLDNRSIMDLLYGDALDRLTFISTLAPPLSGPDAYKAVLSSRDSYMHDKSLTHPLSAVELAAIESRRILFVLLGDALRSPFIAHITSASRGGQQHGRDQRPDAPAASSQVQQLTRSISSLIGSDQRNLPMRAFVVHCLRTTPQLLPALFRATSMPDLKATFDCISKLDFLSYLIREGPQVWSCLGLTTMGGSSLSRRLQPKAEQLLSHIMPTALSKPFLSKAVQSSNALLVSEALKIICDVLERGRTFILDASQTELGSSQVVISLPDSLHRRLPKVQALLAIRTRFDPFSAADDEEVDKETNLTARGFVALSLCEVLKKYALVLPRAVGTVKFDWTKLLPDDMNSFFCVDTVLQCRLLETLHELSAPQSVIPKDRSHEPQLGIHFSSKAFSSFSMISLTSNEPQVRTISRKLAIGAILNSISSPNSGNSEVRNCINREITMWVDGASEETLPSLCKLLNAAQQYAVQHSLSATQAWSKAFPKASMQFLCFSPLLSAALAGISFRPEEFSEPFIRLVCQVSTKSLLYHRSPLPLAAFIVHCFGSTNMEELRPQEASMQLLHEYAKSILVGPCSSLKTLSSLQSNIFSHDSAYVEICRLASGGATHQVNDCINGLLSTCDECLLEPVVRQCLNHLTLQSVSTMSGDTIHDMYEVIKFALVRAVKADDEESRADIIEATFGHPVLQRDEFSSQKGVDLAISLKSALHEGTSMETFPLLNSYVTSWLSAFIESTRNSVPDEATITLAVQLTPHLPPSCAFSAIGKLLTRCAEQSENSKDALLRSLLLSMMRNSLTLEMLTGADFPISSAFQLWLAISSDRNKAKMDVQLCSELEGILSGILRNGEAQGANAAALFLHCVENQDKAVENWLLMQSTQSSQRDSTSGHHRVHSSLLSAMVKYDRTSFAPSISKMVTRINSDSDVGTMFEEGCLDHILVAFMEEFDLQPSLLEDSIHPLLTNAVARRLCSLINTAVESEFRNRDALSHLECLTAILPIIFQQKCMETDTDTLTALVLWFQTTHDNPRLKIVAQVEESIIEATAAITNASAIKCDENESFTHLRTLLFLRLCTLVPKALRKANRRPTCVLKSLVQILSSECLIDTSDILANDACVRSCVVACLKYGVSDNDKSDIAGCCLCVVRFLVGKASTSLKGLSRTSILRPAQVHEMIASHSKFHCALSPQAGNELATSRRIEDESRVERKDPKLELIRLITCCASLAKQSLRVEKETWSAVLGSYNAGMTEEDQSLRRLMYLYDRSVRSNEQSIAHMDELQWGDFSQGRGQWKSKRDAIDGGDDARHWEWFINALDIRRIRSTLQHFPLWDTLEPRPDFSIEPWGVSGDENDNLEEVGAALDDDEQSLSSEEQGDALMSKNKVEATKSGPHSPPNSAESMDTWQQHGPDDRYSPAFVVPLILGLLEAFAPAGSANVAVYSDQSMASNSRNEDDDVSAPDSAQRETFAKIVHRLCEKGCISLTLATLSSKCAALRRVAVASLGLFMRALHSKEARELRTWRERPQFAMVLDSVQRGLVVRRSMFIASRREENQDPSMPGLRLRQPLLVPMLPAVSAIFLARAALIVSKPGDDMFGPINRFFLRLEENHGAYKDCFGLPAFISLFCGSSADDVGQARRERLWALQLLKDGTRDTYCYKVAARRHAPALLFTSFDFASRESSSDVEQFLILETIESLLLNGGRSSCLHLIANLGALSWMKGVLVGRSHESLLPTLRLRCKFLHLIAAAFERAMMQEKDEPGSIGHVHAEAFNLTRPLMELYATTTQRWREGGELSSTDDSAEFLSALCNALMSMALTTSTMKDQIGFVDSFREDGASLVSASSLLALVGDKQEMKAKAVGPLCLLPLSVDTADSNTAKKFCLDILSHIVGTDISAHIFAHALRRVSFLVMVFDDTMKHDGDLIAAVLACRQKSRKCMDGAEAWSRCLSRLVRQDPDDEEEHQTDAEIAAKILRLSQ